MKSLLTTLLLFFVTISYGQFRNTTWGMSLEEVKSIEKAKLTIGYADDKLEYEFHVDDMDCTLTYNFSNEDQLIEIKYEFKPEPLTIGQTNNYPIWKKTIKNIGTKYGEPTEILSEKVMKWDLENFSIKAYRGVYLGGENIMVIYTPPSPSQKDIL